MVILKKIWAFLKTHWYIPVIIIIGLILRSQNNRMLEIIDASKKSYDKQKEAIENAEKEKEVQKQKIEKEYNSLKACKKDASKEIIKKLKEFDHMYDWKRAACTNSAFTVYMHPTHPNLEGEIAKYENTNRSYIRFNE